MRHLPFLQQPWPQSDDLARDAVRARPPPPPPPPSSSSSSSSSSSFLLSELCTLYLISGTFRFVQEMISIFHEATAKVAATPDTPWLKLEAGDALVLDNYRMFHGKKPALVFLVHFTTMMKHAIILTRQARDRHRNNSQRQTTVDVCPLGRAPYKNSDRLLWRQWVWTAESKAVRFRNRNRFSVVLYCVLLSQSLGG